MNNGLKQAVVRIFITLLFPGLLLGGCRCRCDRAPDQQGKVEFCRVEVNGKIIDAEIADTSYKRTRGLSGRKELGKACGMLFIFPATDKRSFWMKGCLLDIDIAYIDNNRIIKEIYTMKKEPAGVSDNLLKAYTSESSSIMYVLEMNAGWFEESKVTIGSKITIVYN